MENRTALLRAIPQVDELLREPGLARAAQQQGRAAALGAVRAELDARRASILRGECPAVPPPSLLCAAVRERLRSAGPPRLRRLLNARGVALHTNVGRAPLSDAARSAVGDAAGCCDLEYDLETGERGSRGVHVEPLLKDLCGCGDALVVNNNAAAVLLALAALARGREVAVSRGELVEIGDGFRIHDILEQSGARLREVGSTNRTGPGDYEAACAEGDVAALLKVHTSNFRVVGFTASASVGELASLAKRREIPLVVDLGSGALLEAEEYPFPGEPTVPQTLREGADVVCFSGDKLLGGPQAGILVGRAALIERMRRHPLARALRIDKLSLAALAATLESYADPVRAKREIPALRMLCTPPETLRARAEELCGMISRLGADCACEVVPTERPVGGGCAPGRLLKGSAVAVTARAFGADALAARLRAAPVPVVARISEGRLLLDVSTMLPEELAPAAEAVKAGCGP